MRNEYTLWHLTPRGWEAGDSRFHHGRRQKPKPPDAVLTIEYSEPVQGRASVDEVWRDSENQQAVEDLLKQYHECPHRLDL